MTNRININDCKTLSEVEGVLASVGVVASFSKPFLNKDIMTKWEQSNQDEDCGLLARIKINGDVVNINDKLNDLGIMVKSGFTNEYLTIVISGAKCSDFCFSILVEKANEMLKANKINDKSIFDGFSFYAKFYQNRQIISGLLRKFETNNAIKDLYRTELMLLKNLIEKKNVLQV
jgi:hypothetical protein